MTSPFVLFTCQPGAEKAIKQQMTTPQSGFRLAFSRPGLLSLKGPIERGLWDGDLPENPFARTICNVAGRAEGESATELVSKVRVLVGDYRPDLIHVWQRDPTVPGWHGYEPGVTPLAQEVGELIALQFDSTNPPAVNVVAQLGQNVLDVVLSEPNQWLVGGHKASHPASCWPGGVFPIDPPEEMLSRAYLKMAEAIAWSRLPIQPGDAIVEIGSAPGGSCQRLLELGLLVTGVDPAEMDPWIIAQPNFTHFRGKAASLKRKLFNRFRWLTADANVAPNYTLDAVEAIVTYPTVKIEGLLLTLKISDWSQVDDLHHHLARIASWGYGQIRMRQLSYNRREVCVVAIKSPSKSRKKARGNRKPKRRVLRPRQPSENPPPA